MPKNGVGFQGGGNKIFFPPKHQDHLWEPPKFPLNSYRVFFSRVYKVRQETKHYLVSTLVPRMHEATIPLSDISSWPST